VNDSRPIKVFYLINSFALGGAERQMAELVRRLPRDRFEPVLGLLGPENAYAHLLPSDQPRYVLERGMLPFGLRHLRTWLREEQPDIVHSFMERSNLWNRLLAPGIGRPVVVSSVRSRMMSPGYRLVEAWLARRADAVVVNSAGTREELVRWQRVPPDKIRIIHNILDFERFQPAEAALREAVRLRLGLGGRVFFVPGRISVSKHQLGLVMAVGRLKRRGRLPPDAMFLLAGRVFDGGVARALPALMRAQGVADRFRYLGPQKDMTELYAASNWVLLPSLYEGLPNAALEAHACARPLLMSHSANLDAIMEPGRTGLEFATGWVEPLAAALEEALAMPAARLEEMGRAGRTRVLARFDPARALQSVIDLYDELLAGRARRGKA
jgi:glycosyltransferase involved in cell wall biosynthesis